MRQDVGVAILGYGVVGKGVAHGIRNNSGHIAQRTGLNLRVAHILDLFDFPDSPDAALITHDPQDIFDDDGVHVVAEVMGGLKAAYEFTKAALSRKKHVVTSNKELVAEHGPELLALASQNGVYYRFDASVGGGIPIITPIEECLAPSNIREITGILNGTTNYMLTYMREHGAQFDETLKLAQDNGFAERDPSADVGGHDARRKLAILSSLVWGAFLDWKDIHTEGITDVTHEDISMAADLGRVLRLIARAAIRGDGTAEAGVLPVMLDRRHPLAHVDGVNNAVIFGCDLNGDIMLYGHGAGMLPTGGAVISDIIKVAGASKPPLGNPIWDRVRALEAADFDTYVHDYYIRVETPDPDMYREFLFREFPEARILPRFADTGAGAVGVDGCEGADDDEGAGADAGKCAGTAGNVGTAAAVSTCIFTVPKMQEGELSRRLARINDIVAGTATGLIARLM